MRVFLRPRHQSSAILAAFCLFLVAASVRGQGELDELRDSVRTSPPPASGGAPPRPPAKDQDDDDCEDFDDDCDDGWSGGAVLGLAYLTGLAATAPFWGPPLLAGDSYTQPGFFSCFPYQYDVGYMLIGPGEAVGLPGSREPWPWAIRGRAEYGTDFDGLEWTGGQVLAETTWRWGIDADTRHVREQLLPAGHDSLWLGDVNVHFRFAQSPSLQMRAGLGMNYLSDPLGSDFGFNFTYGGDWFPVQPLIVSGELDIGTLGSSQLYHLRATAGANFGMSEAYVGYDYTDIGHTQIAGLVAGVRLWY